MKQVDFVDLGVGEVKVLLGFTLEVFGLMSRSQDWIGARVVNIWEQTQLKNFRDSTSVW